MDSSLLATFRAKFSTLYLDPPSEKRSLFDERDVTRLIEDDQYAKKFLAWRNNAVEEAVKLAETVLEWRKKHAMNDMSSNDISTEFYAKKSMFIHGKCKDGNPIVYFIGKRFHKEEEVHAKKLILFLLETIQREDPGSRVTFILDASDCGMGNVDLGLIRVIVDCFMVHFPSLLGRTYVVELPTILTAIWNIVKLWFNEEIRSRTHNCAMKELSKCVESDQLLTVTGGENTWEPTDILRDLEAEFSNDEFSDALDK